ncbi:hypothetical protein SFUMM280S_04008 [Streptomyces fumanus]
MATEKYNAADEKAKAQQKQVTLLNGKVKAAEEKEARLRELLGAAARAQYRGGGLPAEVQFAFASDPERALDDAAVVRQAQQGTRQKLAALEAARAELRTRTDEATAELAELKSTRRAMARHREKIKARIATARALESGLQAEELRRLAALERQQEAESQAEWVGTGILDQVGTQATEAGRAAIEYATEQLGKPYVWGAEGPDSFDCSGLTSQAWLHAGLVIPRTAEQQSGPAPPRPDLPDAPRRPDHLLRRRQPRRHLHRRRQDHPGAAAGALGVRVAGGVDGDPGGGAAGRVRGTGRPPRGLGLGLAEDAYVRAGGVNPRRGRGRRPRSGVGSVIDRR